MKIRVVELARGSWRASIDGEEQTAAVDRAPDQALAQLIITNLRRFNLDEISYASMAGAAEAGNSSHGSTVFPIPSTEPNKRKERG